MEISQTPQDTTKGKLPRGKEPEPFEDEVDKMEKVNRKKRKIPRWKDSNTYEDIPFAKWDRSFLYDYYMDPTSPDDVDIPFAKWGRSFLYDYYMDDEPFEDMLDEKTIEKHDTVFDIAFAKYQRIKELKLLNEEVNKTQKVDSTKGKLPLGKEPEPFKEEVDKTQKVDSTKGKLPRGKEPEPFKVDTEQKVIWPSQQLPLCFEPKIYGEVDTKQMKNKKLPRWSDPKTYEAIRLSNGKHPFMYDKLIEPVESDDSDRPVESDYYDEPVESDDSDEPVQSILDEKTIAKHNTQVAGALDRSEREKELELSKEVDKTQKVDSTKGKLPSGKEPEPFKGNNHTM